MTTTREDSSSDTISVAIPIPVLTLYGPSTGLMLAQAAFLTKLYNSAFHMPMRGEPDPTATTLIGRIGSWAALGLSPRRQRRALDRLTADGLISTWLGKIPCRRWYEVDLAAYDEIAAGGNKSSPPAVPNRHPRQPLPDAPSDDGPARLAVAVPDCKLCQGGAANKQNNKTKRDLLDTTEPRADTRAADGEIRHDHRDVAPQPPPQVAAVIDRIASRGRRPTGLRLTLIQRWRDGELRVVPGDIPEHLIVEIARAGETRDAVIERILRLCRLPPSDSDRPAPPLAPTPRPIAPAPESTAAAQHINECRRTLFGHGKSDRKSGKKT